MSRLFQLVVVLTALVTCLAFSSPPRRPTHAAADGRSSITVCSKAAAAAAMIATLTLTNAPAFASDLTNGATLFQANCAGCHGGGLNYVAEKKTLKKDALEKYQSLDQGKLKTFVQKKLPHNLLPFSKSFSDSDYTDVVDFVLDQALNEKW